MENQGHNNRNQEVDLAIVSVKIKKYISRVNDSFFNGILFLKRNIIWLLVVIIAGAALGYYMDQGEKSYDHKVIVVPNFESVDYLYETIDLLNKKIKDKDYEFLRNEVGIKGSISLIEVDPVIEIYDFISSEEEQDRNFQVFRIIAESDEMENILEDMPTARNYSKHTITITTTGKSTRENVVDPILNYLNSDSYFKQVQVKYIESLNAEIAANDLTIKQIDNTFEGFSDKVNQANSLIYYNNNTQLNELVKAKNKLLETQRINRVNLINYSDIIKNVGLTVNSKRKSIITGKMKVIVPVVFVFFFLVIAMFVSYYKRQINKRKQITA